MKTATLTWEMHKASLRAGSGTGTVSLLALAALTVSSTIAFLVAGGTWMFYQRAQHPEDASAVVQSYMESSPGIIYTWMYLAAIACAFILPALFGLVAQSAIMGASGREQRLATLRLLGLSAADVTRMTVWETALQAVVGAALGAALSVLVLPAFTRLKFMDQRIEMHELLLPWWGYLAVAAVIIVVASAAAFAGMQRVRVTPLGVARREAPKAMRMWRLILFVVVLAAGTLILPRLSLDATAGVWLGIAGFLFVVVMMVNVVTPLVIQVAFQIAANFPGTAHFVASRRISTDAKAAWRRSSSLAFLGIIAGFMVSSPMGDDDLSQALTEDPEAAMLFGDVATGAALTLAFGYILSALAVLLGQASEVFESAGLARSLQLIGVRRRFQSAVAMINVMGPMLLTSVFGFAVGAALGLMMFAQGAGYVNIPMRLFNAGLLLSVGWALALLALLAMEPLRSRVLAHASRRND